RGTSETLRSSSGRGSLTAPNVTPSASSPVSSSSVTLRRRAGWTRSRWGSLRSLASLGGCATGGPCSRYFRQHSARARRAEVAAERPPSHGQLTPPNHFPRPRAGAADLGRLIAMIEDVASHSRGADAGGRVLFAHRDRPERRWRADGGRRSAYVTWA